MYPQLEGGFGFNVHALNVRPLFLDFKAHIFLEALIKNQRTKFFAKSIFTSILKVSEKFIENAIGILMIDTWPKWHFEK